MGGSGKGNRGQNEKSVTDQRKELQLSSTDNREALITMKRGSDSIINYQKCPLCNKPANSVI